MPPRLAAVVLVVRVLLTYGRRLMETVEPRSRNIQFATIASAFGTEKLETILRRVERGLLRAIALERYLVARACRGRDLSIVKRRVNGQPVGFTDPPAGGTSSSDTSSSDTDPEHAPARTTASKPPRRKSEPDWVAQLGPDHSFNFCIYTMEQVEQQVRRWPVGRSIAAICNDLAVIPAFCTIQFWGEIYSALYWYGGSLDVIWKAQERRENAFEKEREGRYGAWLWDWRDRRQERVRRALGCLIGEAPMLDPPDPPPATAPP